MEAPARWAGADEEAAMSRYRAFTLVEALVVAAVVALVIGILIPTLGGARDAARGAGCLANLRTMQVAQLAYAQEKDGRLVDVGLAHGGVYVNEQGSWITTLEAYYAAPAARRCGSDGSPHWPVEDGGDGEAVPGAQAGRQRRTSYGVNNYLTSLAPGRAWTRLGQVPSPARTVQFLEMAERGAFAASDHPHVENWHVPGLTEYAPTLASEQVEINQHGGKRDAKTAGARANWGYLDGHVESRAFGEVYTDAERNSFDPEVAR